jgi:hypothetical protein
MGMRRIKYCYSQISIIINLITGFERFMGIWEMKTNVPAGLEILKHTCLNTSHVMHMGSTAPFTESLSFNSKDLMDEPLALERINPAVKPAKRDLT